MFPARGCNKDLNTDLYQFKCAMYTEPLSDLSDRFHSHSAYEGCAAAPLKHVHKEGPL